MKRVRDRETERGNRREGDGTIRDFNSLHEWVSPVFMIMSRLHAINLYDTLTLTHTHTPNSATSTLIMKRTAHKLHSLFVHRVNTDFWEALTNSTGPVLFHTRARWSLSHSIGNSNTIFQSTHIGESGVVWDTSAVDLIWNSEALWCDAVWDTSTFLWSCKVIV